jgi:hypothetical protein
VSIPTFILLLRFGLSLLVGLALLAAFSAAIYYAFIR